MVTRFTERKKNTHNSIQVVQFNSFDVESGTDCSFDYVKILHGMNSDGTNIGKYCDANSPPAAGFTVPRGQMLFIIFVSNSESERTGFEISITRRESAGMQNIGVSFIFKPKLDNLNYLSFVT